MKNTNDKFGIILSVVITAIAVGFVGTIGSQNGSIQPQGESVIDRTTSELKNIPDKVEEITSNTFDQAENIITETPETANEIIEESDSVREAVENTADVIEDVLPDVPQSVKQNEGTLIELISIPPETSVPGCEKSNACYIPSKTTMQKGGEVIWTNHDTVAHTVTSGNPRDGPDGLFDSGLILPEKTYSVELNIPFEYDYFCLVHPWMQGTIIIQ